jgi:arabinogalactan oligomer/maltooligosaccharide transport system substrate-binding protein
VSNVLSALPNWIQAVGSVSALAFAAGAVVVARRMYGVESDRDQMNAVARQAQQALAQKAQAALVSAWWGLSVDGQTGIFVRNASEAPVYQVFLTVVAVDNYAEETKIYSLVVPPSDHAIFTPVDTQIPTARAAAQRVKLSFTDAAGVRWLRNEYGLLTQSIPNLCVMADVRRTAVLGQFEEDFRSTYGVRVTFKKSPRDYPQESHVSDLKSRGIDAVICPHDWIGNLVAQRVLEPTVLCADHRNAFPAWALSALTVGNRLYGLPTTIDTVALFRNTKLAPRRPATFDELLTMGQDLKKADLVTEVLALRVGERGDPFQVWPLFSSAGGWLFGRTSDGQWDPARIGLGTPESIAAFERLRELGEAGIGVLRRSIDREAALNLFATGRTAFLISTSDGLEPARAAGIPVAVSAVPPFVGGKEASAFSLVHGLVMASLGTNTVIAHDLFADYLSHADVMTALSVGTVGPVAMAETASKDTEIQQLFTLCESAVAMPAFPEMKAVWRVLEEAEVAVITGAPAESTALTAAAKLVEIFAAKET